MRSLLWDNYRGLTAAMIHRVLRGDETYLSSASGRRRPLWPNLLYHRLRGVDPGIRLPHVTEALDRLSVAGDVVTPGQGIWRLRRHVERDAVRAAQAAQAARAAQQNPPAGAGPSDSSMPADQQQRAARQAQAGRARQTGKQGPPDNDPPGRPGGRADRTVRS